MAHVADYLVDAVEKLKLAMVPDDTQEAWDAHETRMAAQRAEQEAELERRRQDELRRDLAANGCPVKDLERALSGKVDETPAVVAARSSLAEGMVLSVLGGRRGTGKTTAAAWWLVQRREPSRYLRTGPARFVDASALSRWPRFDDERMRELERASALVIDDLGIEYDDKGGAFRSFLDGLVNARYAAQLPTLITTNLPASEFKARYGERVADRIRECGRYVELDGESLRRRP
jgi:DNA replication protein DnaC